MLTKMLRCLLLVVFVVTSAYAQNYPAKSVRIIVPYAPGGSVDSVTRLVGQKFTKEFGQPFIVENRAGASGNIGTDSAAKAAPDGYTLLMSSSPPLAANIHLFKKLPFDPFKDFAPIMLIANQPNVLVLNPSVPAGSVKELIELAKSKPGKLTFGSSGVGASQHMAAELFMMMTGVNMKHVPYKGGGPAMVDLIGGHIDLMLETAPSAIPFVHSGKVKALAVTTLQRSGRLPNVPTLDEAGLKGYEFRGWIGLVAPAGVPKEIIAKLHDQLQKDIAGDLRKQLDEMGLDIAGGTPQQFADFIRKDSDMYAKLVKAANIAPR
ncbi:MAG: ABC transporter substrate-binding protein [Syntrophus sp. RIFOXYC2_FULL_54_9]|nr:MAG: ABC transporter substrate-binding protein [Syntrophus sp. GWC2_56_31]OHE27219.1 MAG: ABC transporter substrate-binding protein [Syntrophus sp. RIFOXYC2_FULL_54_9]HBB16194.1 ABC transporter substrate-binding protein [Syntrophus sp. (in: bacteria)]